MKLQFSLATLLVCMTVLAVVAAVSVTIPVVVPTFVQPIGHWQGQQYETVYMHDPMESRPPSQQEFAWRLTMWGSASIAALWAIRRLKSRRHTEPPGG